MIKFKRGLNNYLLQIFIFVGKNDNVAKFKLTLQRKKIRLRTANESSENECGSWIGGKTGTFLKVRVCCLCTIS